MFASQILGLVGNGPAASSPLYLTRVICLIFDDYPKIVKGSKYFPVYTTDFERITILYLYSQTVKEE